MISRDPREPPRVNFPRNFKRINIFADFETFLHADGYDLCSMTEEERHAVLAAHSRVIPWLMGYTAPAIKERNGAMYVDVEHYQNHWSIDYPHEEFFKLLGRLYGMGGIPVIWFHNAAYDLTAAIGTCFKRLDPDMNCHFYCKDDDKGFLHGAMRSKKYGFSAEFGDTLLYKRISLSVVGDMLGLPKGEIPYTMANLCVIEGEVLYTNWKTGRREKVSLQECVTYVIRDVELLQQYYMQLQEEKELMTLAVNKEHASIKTTTQGIHSKNLLDLFIHKHTNHRLENMFRFRINEEEYMTQQRSKSGGYSSLNKYITHFRCENEWDGWEITSYDCNSMYPSIMKEGLPYGELLLNPPEGRFVEWVYIWAKGVHGGGIMETCENAPIPVKQQSMKDRVIEFYIDRETLEFIKANMNETGIIKEHHSYYQRVTNVVGAFVDYLYKTRNELRKGMEEVGKGSAAYLKYDVMQKGVKTTMNALYGKLCEGTYEVKTWYTHEGFNHALIDDAKRCNMLTGVYIALRGRYILYKKIKGVLERGFKFLYADTDSVKFAHPPGSERQIEEVFGMRSDELGGGKCEGVWHEYINPGKKKKYCFINWDDCTKSSFTLSGIHDKYIAALKNGLVHHPDQTVADLRYIFDGKNNVVFRDAKTMKTRTMQLDQYIITDIHVSSNPHKEKTAECGLEGVTYKLEKV